MTGKNTDKPTLPPGIYGITAEKYSRGRGNIEVVREMIAGGIGIIQYREKRPAKSFAAMLEECREIRRLTRAAGVLFIVNDYCEIARLVDADGVHVGQDDLPVAAVRELIGPGKIIGLSTHSPEQAAEAAVGRGGLYRRRADLCHRHQGRCLRPGRPGIPRACRAHLPPALRGHRRHQGAQYRPGRPSRREDGLPGHRDRRGRGHNRHRPQAADRPA